MPAVHAPALSYQPALDGLRGVAIAVVIAYHFGAGWAGGGFLGVDAFFVLSGYFVTNIVLSEWARRGRLDFAAFWAARLRRLVPALGLVVLAVAAWSHFGADSIRLDAIRGDALWAIVFGSNWHFIVEGQSYFDLYSEPSPLRHTWMLAAIVQFYLVWPALMVVCLRVARESRRALGALALVGIAISAGLLAALHSPVDPSRAYYGTDSRASQLLVGALLAIGLVHRPLRTQAARTGVQVLGALGALGAICLFAIARDRDVWLYRGGFLVAAVAFAAVVAAVVQPGRSPVRILLALPPVVWVGKISYGLFLWHWPVKVVLSESRIGIDGWALTSVWIAATFALALPSYYLVERPIRRGTLVRGRWMQVVAPAALVLTALVVIGATAGATAPPSFLTAPQGKVLRSDVPRDVQVTAPDGGVPDRWLLVGDSVAASLAPAVQAEAADRGVTLTAATRPGCGVITGIPALPDGTEIAWGRKCDREAVSYLETSVRDGAPQVVLWLSTWEAADRIVDGVFYPFGTARADAMLLQRFEESRALLTSAGARLVVLTTPPSAAENELGLRDRPLERRTLHLNELLRELARANPASVTLVDFAELVCPSGPPCPAVVDGVTLRPRDGGHFEGEGPAWVAPRLLDLVTAALAAGDR